MLACRPMLCFALAVMAGAVAARLQPETFRYTPAGWIVFALLAAWFFLTPKAAAVPVADLPDGYGEHILPMPGFLARRGLNRFILICCLGFLLLAAHRQEAWRLRLSPQGLPEKRWYDASLLALAPRREHAAEDGVWRIPALLLTADGKETGGPPVRLSGREGPSFRRGDLISCRVRAEALSEKAYPGAFDFGLWLERDGLAGTVAVEKPRRQNKGAAEPAYSVTPVDDVSLFTRIRRVVDDIRAEAIGLTMKYGDDQGGVLAAMLYGYRKVMDPEMRDSFRRVGIGHVLAISGLHVGLIVGLLWWTSGWRGWSLRRRSVACLILAVFYLGLSGGQVAASRATLMAVIHLGGQAWGRRGDMLNSLGAAAFFLTLLNPSAPFDVSFQLSFIAVVFIYLALRGGTERTGRAAPGRSPRWRMRLAGELESLIRLSIATWVGLFPIIAVVFNQANLIGLPINIVVIPLMSLVLAGGLLLPWLGWLPGAGWLLVLPSRLLGWIAFGADSLPYSSIPVHAPSGLWPLLFYLFIFLLLLRGMIRNPLLRRRWTIAAMAATGLSLIGMTAGMRSEPPPASGRIAVLPGRGAGTVVVESAQGGIAVIGAFARSGLNEAGWLHYLRRGGRVGILAFGNADEAALAPFAYHYRIGAFTNIAAVGQGETAAWLPAPGAAGVEYAVSRDSRGRVVWLAVRTGDKSVCVAPRLSGRQLAWRMERRIPGHDADLLCLGFGNAAATEHLPGMAGQVAVLYGFRGELPPGWFRRRDFGVLVIGDDLRGYAGGGWRRAGSD